MAGAPPTRWWWIRHAPVIGGGHVLYGQQDLDCDLTDADHLAAVARALPTPCVWLATPLRRTQRTLAAIVAARSESLETTHPLVEPAFSEQHFGQWQGLSWDAMRTKDPELYQRFWADPTEGAPPGGESFAAAVARVRDGILRLTREHAGADIVAVAHGGSIRAAVAVALDLTPTQAMAITIDPLSLTRLSYIADGLLHGKGGCWRVDGVNASCRWIS